MLVAMMCAREGVAYPRILQLLRLYLCAIVVVEIPGVNLTGFPTDLLMPPTRSFTPATEKQEMHPMTRCKG